ncbi:MAG: Ribosomal RNA large subunit methyltransferase L [Syntrophorhabdus sp. PtaU1.Bin050]|nr:MAG: Ribosomal RNA large subunit methyltransferase L [Syntrophorhabdus sp. PtaU1.Bin050]
MARYVLIATCSFGLESLVAQELRWLGYDELTVENGRVTFNGDEKDIARCNIWLRTADRVLVKIKEFKATDFEELFRGTLDFGWEELFPVDGRMYVIGKSVRSTLSSVKDCQSIAKKAIIQAMRRRYHIAQFPETGPLYKVEVGLLKDVATLTIDTTGDGLHKRGYREESGEAPLRENLAAALVMLSRWTPDRVLADPLCGAGTIAIEAALIGRNMAPGLRRTFASEKWGQIPGNTWRSARDDAVAQINTTSFRVLASDRDGKAVKKARDNALRAGVRDFIGFQRLPIEDFRSSRKYGCVICNPPYGERMGESKEVEELYKSMGGVFSKLDTWSLFILTAHPHFETLFDRKANRNRKLYNGNMRCYYYEYFGQLPPRRATVRAENQG